MRCPSSFRIIAFLLLLSSVFTIQGFSQWQQFREPYGGAIHCIARSQDILFAGGYHLYSSSDNGHHWDVVTSFPDRQVAVLLGNNGFIFAGTPDTWGSLYRSGDQGQTWVKLNIPISPRGIISIISVMGTIIACTGPNGSSPGIYLSEDNGDSWTLPETEVADHTVNSICNIGNILYACSFDGIYKSLDQGHHWEIFTNAFYNAQTLVHANNRFIATTLFACRRSSDGITWDTAMNDIFIPVSMVALDSAGGNGQRLLLGAWSSGWNAGGMYFSDDNGSNWFPVNDVNKRNDQVNCIIKMDSMLFTGTRSDGILRSSDQADNWILSNSGITERTFQKLATGDEIIVVAEQNEKALFTSEDKGISWESHGLNEISARESIRDLMVKEDRIFAATSEGIYRKRISDSAWSVQMPDSSFWYLAKTGQTLYAATRLALLRSNDDGDSWIKCNGESGLPYILAVSAIGPAVVVVLDDSVLYSADAGEHFFSSTLPGFWNQSVLMTNDGVDFYIASEGRGVMRTTDKGITWETVNDSIFSYLYGLTAMPGSLFISTRDGGVIHSTDQGRTWTPYNQGFPGYATNVNAISLSGDTLYAIGTTNYRGGMGVYKRSAYPAWIQTGKGNKTGIRITPNPADDFIQIEIQEHNHPCKGIIRIIDSRGKTISLFHFDSSTGLVRINTADFVPGFYMLEVVLENQDASLGKFIVNH